LRYLTAYALIDLMVFVLAQAAAMHASESVVSVKLLYE
jgi:hypothetical protein